MQPNNFQEESQPLSHQEDVQMVSEGQIMAKTEREKNLENLERLEKNVELSLSKEQLQNRKTVIKIIIKEARALQLKKKTIEHAIRLLDMVLQKEAELIEFKEKVKLALTCISLSAKYIEVYPPNLLNLEDMAFEKISCQEFMKSEIRILKLIEFNLNFTVASDWCKFLYGQDIPDWAIFCYERAINCPMKKLAELIHKIEQNHQKEGAKKKLDAFCKPEKK